LWLVFEGVDVGSEEGLRCSRRGSGFASQLNVPEWIRALEKKLMM
jgi:hypothetical protein